MTSQPLPMAGASPAAAVYLSTHPPSGLCASLPRDLAGCSASPWLSTGPGSAGQSSRKLGQWEAQLHIQLPPGRLLFPPQAGQLLSNDAHGCEPGSSCRCFAPLYPRHAGGQDRPLWSLPALCTQVGHVF